MLCFGLAVPCAGCQASLESWHFPTWQEAGQYSVDGGRDIYKQSRRADEHRHYCCKMAEPTKGLPHKTLMQGAREVPVFAYTHGIVASGVSRVFWWMSNTREVSHAADVLFPSHTPIMALYSCL